jgi:hypothetical protein
MGLVDEFNSEYIRLSRSFSATPDKKQLLAFVEGDEDITFWTIVLRHYTSYNVSVQILKIPDEYGRQMHVYGKDALLNVSGLGENKIVCVDADFDLLLPNNKYHLRLINDHYVINTYYYALENILSCPKYLKDTVENGRTQKSNVDYEAMLHTMSHTIAPIFKLALAARENWNITHTANYYNKSMFSHTVNGMHPLPNNYINRVSNIRYNNGEDSLLQQKAEEIQNMSDTIAHIIINDGEIYKFIRGHTLYGCILAQLLSADIKICNGSMNKPSSDEVKRMFYSCTCLSPQCIPNEIYSNNSRRQAAWQQCLLLAMI